MCPDSLSKRTGTWQHLHDASARRNERNTHIRSRIHTRLEQTADPSFFSLFALQSNKICRVQSARWIRKCKYFVSPTAVSLPVFSAKLARGHHSLFVPSPAESTRAAGGRDYRLVPWWPSRSAGGVVISRSKLPSPAKSC